MFEKFERHSTRVPRVSPLGGGRDRRWPPSSLHCALAAVGIAVLSTGCVSFHQPKDLVYRLPDPQAIAACYSSPGGACSVVEAATALPEDYFGNLKREAQERIASRRIVSARQGESGDLALEALAATAEVLEVIVEGDDGEMIEEGLLIRARANLLHSVAYDAFSDFESPTFTQGMNPALAKSGKFVSEYLKAYFRSGRFGNLVLDPVSLKIKLVEKLRETLAGTMTEAEISLLADQLTQHINPVDFGVVSDQSFVARGGKAYQFKQITLSVTPGSETPVAITKIDGVQVVAEITRIVVEAILDARHQLPAVSNATGVTEALGLIENRACAGTEINQSAATCASPADVGRLVTDLQFAKVESFASQIDGATLALVGSSLRGASWFSLNNEYLATLLETVISVAVRKSAEKVAWCYYTCKPNTPSILLDGMTDPVRVPLMPAVRIVGE